MFWLIHALILSGVRQAAFVNLITTIAKIAPIVLFIAIAFVAFKIDIFTLDFSGASANASAGNAWLGSIMSRVKSTMLVTLWVFIGIEGASVFSGRAERRTDVGVATMAGFLTRLALYAPVSLLALGLMTQPELAGPQKPLDGGRA